MVKILIKAMSRELNEVKESRDASYRKQQGSLRLSNK